MSDGRPPAAAVLGRPGQADPAEARHLLGELLLRVTHACRRLAQGHVTLLELADLRVHARKGLVQGIEAGPAGAGLQGQLRAPGAGLSRRGARLVPALHQFTPARVIDIQRSIGSDIMMILDEGLGRDSRNDPTIEF